MVDKLVAHLLRNLHLKSFEFGMIKFYYLTTLHIHQMLVMFARLLISGPPVAKFQPVDNTRLFKKLDRPVDGGDGNRAVFIDSPAIQLIDIRVVLGLTNDTNDNLALAGHTNAVGKAFLKDVPGHVYSVEVS